MQKRKLVYVSIFVILAVCMALVGISQTAVPADAAVYDPGNLYGIFLLNSDNQGIAQASYNYGNSSLAESFGTTYYFSNHAGGYVAVAAGHGNVRTASMTFYSGDTVKFRFSSWSDALSFNDYYAISFSDNRARVTLPTYNRWETSYTIPANFAGTMVVCARDKSDAHKGANGQFGGNFLTVLIITVQGRSTQIGGNTLTGWVSSYANANNIYSGKAISAFISLSTFANFIGSTSAVNVGTYSVIATPKPAYKWDDGTYGAKAFTWRILPKPITIGFPAVSVNKTYGDAAFTYAINNAGEGNGVVTYSSNNTKVATVNSSTGAVSIAGAGTATITATKAASGNYAAASASYTLNVATAAQSFTFSSASSMTFGQAYTAGVSDAQGAVTYSVTNGTGAATINATTGALNVTKAGTVRITANAAAAGNYAATSKYFDLTIGKAAQTVSFTSAASMTFGQAYTAKANAQGTVAYSVKNGTRHSNDKRRDGHLDSNSSRDRDDHCNGGDYR